MEPAAKPSPTSLGSARLSVFGVFFGCGVLLASWIPYIPIVQARLGLSEGRLGLALLAMAAGALVSILAIGRVIDRFGSRAVTGVSAGIFCLLLPGPIFAPTLPHLFAALFVFGVAMGSMDVAMNAQAAQVEQTAGRPLMSGFHGLFSVGGLCGSALAGVMLEMKVEAGVHVAGVVVAMLALCGVSSIRLLPPRKTQKPAGPRLKAPHGPLMGLAALAFFMFVSEGALIDWTTVYLVNILSVEPGPAASGFAAFSLMMAVGRLTGDWAIARFGTTPLARATAGLSAIGLGLALATDSLWVSVTGFGLAGLGMSNLIPILFSTSARATPENPQSGIGAVVGVGYVGLVAGPPMIGFAAEALGLRGALGLVALTLAIAAMVLGAAFRAAAHGNIRQT